METVSIAIEFHFKCTGKDRSFEYSKQGLSPETQKQHSRGHKLVHAGTDFAALITSERAKSEGARDMGYIV